MSATQRSNMRLDKAIRGFVLPAAIFLLVVLAALGAAIVTVSTTQQIGSALDVQGTRAYQAARAGIEWGLYSVMRGTSDGAGYLAMTSIPAPTVTTALSWCTSVLAASPTLSSFDFTASNAETLKAFTVTVTCFATRDGSGGPWVFSLTATACNQPVSGWTATTIAACPNSPNSFYVERQMTVTF